MAIIRKGMWVTYFGRVGIVAGIGPQKHNPPFQKAIAAGLVDFHEVDGEGVTIKEELVDIRAISQAALLDIPECRRAGLSTAQAIRLGYIPVEG